MTVGRFDDITPEQLDRALPRDLQALAVLSLLEGYDDDDTERPISVLREMGRHLTSPEWKSPNIEQADGMSVRRMRTFFEAKLMESEWWASLP